jgi:hypothetical protein
MESKARAFLLTIVWAAVSTAAGALNASAPASVAAGEVRRHGPLETNDKTQPETLTPVGTRKLGHFRTSQMSGFTRGIA